MAQEALNLKDAVIVSKRGILAAHYNPDHEQGGRLYIQNGTWEALDAQDMIYCPDKKVLVMSPPLRGDGTQQHLAGVFSALLDAFSAEEIWNIHRYSHHYFKKHISARKYWDQFCKRIYKLTVQAKTLVNVRGVLLEVTRKGGMAAIQVITTGYDDIPRHLYADKRFAYASMLMPIWIPQKERGDFRERGIKYAIYALERASPFFEGIRVIPWPQGMEPIPYRLMDVPVTPSPRAMVHGVMADRYVTREQLVVRGVSREEVVSCW